MSGVLQPPFRVAFAEHALRPCECGSQVWYVFMASIHGPGMSALAAQCMACGKPRAAYA